MMDLIILGIFTAVYFLLVFWMAKGLIRGLFYLQRLVHSSSRAKSEANPES